MDMPPRDFDPKREEEKAAFAKLVHEWLLAMGLSEEQIQNLAGQSRDA